MQAGAWIFPLQRAKEVSRLFTGENQYFQSGNLFHQRQHSGDLGEHAACYICPVGSSETGNMPGKVCGCYFLEQMPMGGEISPHPGFPTGQQDALRVELKRQMSEQIFRGENRPTKDLVECNISVDDRQETVR